MTCTVEILEAAFGSRPDQAVDAVWIAEQIRMAITIGALPVGTKVGQQALADFFGVSRMPVREAIRLAQAQGLLSNPRHMTPEVQSIAVVEDIGVELALARLKIVELEDALKQLRSEIDGACQCAAHTRTHSSPLAIIERALPASAV